jgi:hypothetical protein
MANSFVGNTYKKTGEGVTFVLPTRGWNTLQHLAYSLPRFLVLLSLLSLQSRPFNPREPTTMEWTTPQHEEIDLNCEISSYANAEL